MQPVEAKGQTKSVNPSIQPTDEPTPPCNSSPNYTPSNNVPQNDKDCDDETEGLNSNSNNATPSLLSYSPISNEQINIPKLKNSSNRFV